MPAPPAIRVCPVTPALRAAVLRLRVQPAQDDFVSPPAVTLPDAERCAGSTPMAILQDDAVVGYYRIEASAHTLTGEESERGALGLRSFQIDAGRQGRGLGAGALAALLLDLRSRAPQARELVLTVDRSNAAALGLYLRAGFRDSGRLYHGGRAGPQLLLRRALP
jgi:ribosomal protein S18 acetylase RimI-like enzyme